MKVNYCYVDDEEVVCLARYSITRNAEARCEYFIESSSEGKCKWRYKTENCACSAALEAFNDREAMRKMEDL